jgi:hypothetical protein
MSENSKLIPLENAARAAGAIASITRFGGALATPLAAALFVLPRAHDSSAIRAARPLDAPRHFAPALSPHLLALANLAALATPRGIAPLAPRLAPPGAPISPPRDPDRGEAAPRERIAREPSAVSYAAAAHAGRILDRGASLGTFARAARAVGSMRESAAAVGAARDTNKVVSQAPHQDFAAERADARGLNGSAVRGASAWKLMEHATAAIRTIALTTDTRSKDRGRAYPGEYSAGAEAIVRAARRSAHVSAGAPRDAIARAIRFAEPRPLAARDFGARHGSAGAPVTINSSPQITVNLPPGAAAAGEREISRAVTDALEAHAERLYELVARVAAMRARTEF